MSLRRSTGTASLRVRDASTRHAARSFVLYGRSGTGKTTLACTFPGPLLLIDVRDRGTDSVSDVKGLKVFECESLGDFEDAYWWLKKNPKAYKTVVIDTVSQLQTAVVEEVAGQKKKKENKRAGDWGSMTKQQWGEVAGVMKEWLTNYRDLTDLGINVVFIAQDRTFNVGDDGELDDALMPEVGPGLSPSVAKTLNAAVSIVGNTFVRNKVTIKEVKGKKIREETPEYCLRLGPNPVYVTKVRKPRHIEAPDFITNPSYQDVLDIIEGN